jgi:transaldolase
MSGIEQRLTDRYAVDQVASVASFFVSRVDVKADPQLPPESSLRGKVAIANAKLAYGLYQRTLSGPRWRALGAGGAQPQRPLWASTGTKNPAYRDVMYVEELIGRDVVNTMPDKTLRAFADHGRIARTVDADLAEAEAVLTNLASQGLDLDAITTALEREGVASFCDAYHELLDCITERAEALGVRLNPRSNSGR